MRKPNLDYFGLSVLFEHHFDGHLPLDVAIQLPQCELRPSALHSNAAPGSTARPSVATDYP